MGKRTLRQKVRGYIFQSRAERPTKFTVGLSLAGMTSGFVLIGSSFDRYPPDWTLLAFGVIQLLTWTPLAVADIRAYRNYPPNPLHRLQDELASASLSILDGRQKATAASETAGYVLQTGRHHLLRFLLISCVAKADMDEVFLSAGREGYVVNKVFALVTRPKWSGNVLEINQPILIRDTEDGPVPVEQPSPPALSAWQVNKLLRSGAMFAAREDLEALLADLASAWPVETG